MKPVTCVLFDDEERQILHAAVNAVGVGIDLSNEERQEAQRRIRGLTGNRDVIHHHQLTTAQFHLERAGARLGYEAKPLFWESKLSEPMTPDTELMIEVITAARAQYLREVAKALNVVLAALNVAQPRPLTDGDEGLYGDTPWTELREGAEA